MVTPKRAREAATKYLSDYCEELNCKSAEECKNSLTMMISGSARIIETLCGNHVALHVLTIVRDDIHEQPIEVTNSPVH